MKVLNSGKALVVAALAIFSMNFAYAQPANDGCAGAIAITCGQTVTGSNATATNDVTPACGLSAPRKGVWYTITGTGGLITLSTCSATSNFDTQISVYTGTCAALACVTSNDNDPACSNYFGRLSTVSFSSVFGTVYRIMVSGKLSASGTFTLSATCAVVSPPNDLCANAIAVACGSTTTGSTVGSTIDAVGTCTTTLGTAGGVWYTVVGTGGSTTVSLCGSSYDTKMAVFSGTCGALVCVAGNDDFCSLQSQVTFNATLGTTYYILVTGFSTNVGAFTMAVTCAAPPPPTCNCTNTTAFPTAAIAAPTANTTPTTISTCNFPAEFATISNAVAGTSYTFTSSVATDYITVRQGTSGGTALGCGTSPLTVTATANGSLFVHFSLNSACATQASGCRTTTVQCSSCAAPMVPVNDACANAITLTPAATCVTTSGTNAFATQSVAPSTCTGFTSSAALDVWYKFVATQANHVVIVNGGTSLDIVLDARTGACDGTFLACVDAQTTTGAAEVLSLTGLTPGATILVRVYGWAGATGAFTICVTNGATSLVDGSGNGVIEQAVNLQHVDQLEVGNIYPNPARYGQAFINIATPVEGLASIQLFDQAGRIVRNMETELYSGVNKVELNVNNLAQGTYFAAVRVNNEIFHKKLIVIQ